MNWKSVWVVLTFHNYVANITLTFCQCETFWKCQKIIHCTAFSHRIYRNNRPCWGWAEYRVSHLVIHFSIVFTVVIINVDVICGEWLFLLWFLTRMMIVWLTFPKCVHKILILNTFKPLVRTSNQISGFLTPFQWCDNRYSHKKRGVCS